MPTQQLATAFSPLLALWLLDSKKGQGKADCECHLTVTWCKSPDGRTKTWALAHVSILGWADKSCFQPLSPKSTTPCPLAGPCGSCSFMPYPDSPLSQGMQGQVLALVLTHRGPEWLPLGILRTQTRWWRGKCFVTSSGYVKSIPILVHVHTSSTAAWSTPRCCQGSRRPEEMSQDCSAAAASAGVGVVRGPCWNPSSLLQLSLCTCRNHLWCCPLANGGVCNYNLWFSKAVY